MHSLADVAVNMIQEYMLLCTLEPYGTGVSFMPSHNGSADDDTKSPFLPGEQRVKRSFVSQKDRYRLKQMPTNYS